MSPRDFLLNDLAPFLRKRGAIILLVLCFVAAAVILLSHNTTGNIPLPEPENQPGMMPRLDAGGG